MKKSMILITALLAVTLTATSAFSWGHGKGGPGKGCGGAGQAYGVNGPGKGCGGAGQAYGVNGPDAWNDLSKEQKDEISALQQKFIDDTYELRSAMMTKHQEMRLLMETSSPDRAKLLAMSKAITDLQGQMQAKRIDLQLAAKKIAPELEIGGMGRMGGMGGRGNNEDCPRQARRCNQ